MLAKDVIIRVLNMLPILLGVNILTFSLFFIVNTPDDIARFHLGEKYATTQAITQWKQARGFDQPLFYNPAEKGIRTFTHTLFFQKTFPLFLFQFGQSEQGRDISYDITQRMWPSLALAIPTLILGLILNISTALFLVLFRHTYLNGVGLFICLMMMSISTLFYIIIGQFLFSKLLLWAPISGYIPGTSAWRFLLVPLLVGVLSGWGAGTRWYRILFLEECQKDYVDTARAKGLTEVRILFRHVFPNALIPILTQVVAIIPLLFIGSLLMESFFSIPGLGSYTIDAIRQQDFEIVRVMVFISTLFYLVGLLLTDLSYMWADPRIRFTRSEAT